MGHITLDKFGEILIHKVRDKVINDWEMILAGKMKGSSAAKIRDLISGYSIEQVPILEKLIPQVVDTTLLHLLWTLDQLDILKVLLSDTDGTTCDIKELSDGLPGELYGDRGWIKRFSKKPYS
ncbi:MAG: epimerase [Syntrophobacteraceae bacterium]